MSSASTNHIKPGPSESTQNASGETPGGMAGWPSKTCTIITRIGLSTAK